MRQSQIAWKLLLAAGLATTLGCTADGADPVQILRNQAPEEGCVVSSALGGDFLTRGMIDVRSTRGYVFTPLVQSILEQSEVASRLFFAEGIDVDIRFVGTNIPTVSGGLEDSMSFRTLISGSIEAGGLSSYSVDIVTPQLLADLVDDVTPTDPIQLIAAVKVVGDLDGDGVESNTFNYPIEICDGCMNVDLGPCEGLEGGEFSTGGVCNPLQDGFIDCCTAPDDTLVCPAVPIIVPDPA